MTELTTELQRGSELAGYRVEALLGRGGMGVVYLAEQLRLKRRVALKLLAPELAADERFRERFLRESELAASLDHPNVLPVFDAGEADGRLFIAMRYVEGSDLGSLLAQEGRLDPERAVAIVWAVAAGLDAAHARGLVHRDVKPANVLLANDGHVYLADFGLTRSAQEGGSEEKPHLSGTLEYVAPEQIDGEPPAPAADVYALGGVLYHCLAGEPPFAKDSQMALLWAHFDEQPPSLHERCPELPEAIDPVITKALAKEPQERYVSCGELAAATAEALGVGLPASRMSRRRLLLLAAAVSLIVAVAAAVPSLLLTRGNNPAKPTTVITRDTLQRIDPSTNKLVATIPYGREGVAEHRDIGWARGAFAVGVGAVWVFGPGAQTILRIDPRTNAVAGQSAVSLDPNAVTQAGLAAGLGHVWVATGTSALTVIDPRTGLATGVDIPGNQPCPDVGVGYGWVFTTCHNPNSLSPNVVAWRIDPETMTTVDSVSYAETEPIALPTPGAPPGDVGWLGKNTAVGMDQVIVDARTGKRVAISHLPFRMGGWDAWDSNRPWADGNTNGWFSNPNADTVWEVDSHTGNVVAKIPVGDVPAGVARGDGAVWVANSGDGTVSRIDPATGEVVATIEVGGHPASVAVGEGGVWVTVYSA